MPTSQSQTKEAIAQATEQELASLAGRGVRIAGNACSPIVLVKGDLDEAECSGGELAAGADGAALRKALGAIGYAPEDFCVLASVAGAGDGTVAVGQARVRAVPRGAGGPGPRGGTAAGQQRGRRHA
ncbi:MAG: hypothetical protein ACLU37_10125 [Collinsella sp.]